MSVTILALGLRPSVAKEGQILFVDSCQLLKLDEIHSALTKFAL